MGGGLGRGCGLGRVGYGVGRGSRRCASNHASQGEQQGQACTETAALSPFLRHVKETFTPGSQHHGFRVVAVKHVPTYDLMAVALVHDTTGAEFMHLAKDDTNNAFW